MLNQINGPRPFSEILSGESAFYNAPNYVASTQADLAAKTTLPPSYIYNTQHKIVRIAKRILSILIFPIGMYQLLHVIAGKIILPASSPSLLGISKDDVNKKRAAVPLNNQWKYKRITIEVDGYKIDTAII